MSYTFNNKVAIITGSSRGIGRAVAEALASEGASVVLNGRNSAQLNDTLSEFREAGYTCQAIAGDISDYDFCESLVRKTIEQYGKLDILINNAGISTEGSIEESHPATFRRSFEVNVLGVIYPAKAAIPHLKKTKGSIVFTGSVAGFIGLPGFAAYSGSKMALTAITKSLRIELAASDIHVGLNYVGFAENDVDKIVLWKTKPKRKKSKN